MSGVLLNVVTIVAGTAVGVLFGRLISERFRHISFAAIGLATTVIGALMSIGGLTRMEASFEAGRLGERAGDYAVLVVIGSLVFGALVGEALRIEHWLERFGVWLQSLSRRTRLSVEEAANAEAEDGGHTLVDGFVTASLLFCVGAMTVLGSIQDGLGDHQLLYTKSTLDGFAALFLSSTLGIGVGLSVIPVLVIQGGLALGAQALSPLMSGAVITSITAVGGALILAIGIDLLGIKRLPVGNMLPAILIAAVAGGLLG